MAKLTPQIISQSKGLRNLSMVTCYDATAARLIALSDIDMILVGDSVAMVVHGYESTIHATMDMMLMHVAAVRRGCKNKFIVADMPFVIHKLGKYKAVAQAAKLIQAGADAIKIEGVRGHQDVLEHIIESGIPVMGHLGLTPQAIAALGGWKVQGKTPEAANRIVEEVKILEDIGCFALVLECVPSSQANSITCVSKIPIIGIGAGSHTDGQVLVWQDLLGLNLDFKPKFVRHFAQLEPQTIQALNHYHEAIQRKTFPTTEEQYQ